MVTVRKTGSDGLENTFFISMTEEEAKNSCRICEKTFKENEVVYMCELCKHTWHKYCDTRYEFGCSHYTVGGEWTYFCGKVHIE